LRPIYLLLLLTLFSCGTIKYKSTTAENLPELGTIGIFTNYLLEKDHQPKTVVSLSTPIRLSYKGISIKERELFNKKDPLKIIPKDSTLISFEILDKISLIKQLNADNELLKYLTKACNYKIVSQVTLHFPDSVNSRIKKADEVYLIQRKQNTLSLELRKNNKTFDWVEFTDGTIVNFKALEFCWGQNKRRDLEIFDLVSSGSNCGEDTYKSVKKVKKKNEFKF